MKMKTVIGVLCLLVSTPGRIAAGAQDGPSQEQLEKQQALEKKGLLLLEQTAAEAQMLRLPENRIRANISIADLLWSRDQARARLLLSQAAFAILELRNTGTDDRQNNPQQTANQLRQQLVMATAAHDPALAYEFLVMTRQVQPADNQRGFRRQESESGLEMQLLARIAAADPKLALKNAVATIDKGQFPRSLARIAAQIQEKDKDAAAKLVEKITGRLTPETLLANFEAGGLALELLRAGPRPPANQEQGLQIVPGSPVMAQVLDESAYKSLLDSVVSAALTATPRSANPAARQPGGNGQRRQIQPRVPINAANDQAPGPDPQVNARNLLTNLQSLLPRIEKYDSLRAGAVRQRLNDVGGNANQRQGLGPFVELMQSGSVDALIAAAPTAPPGVQTRLYQQAAMKAASEGDAERARQIGRDHLDQSQQDRINQELERQQAMRAVMAGKLSEAQQVLGQLKTDRERVSWLIQMASSAVQRNDQKVAQQLLQEARNLVSRRAENYQQLESQLTVARAYANVNPTPAFELVEACIDQLNELLNAATILNGFEVRVFREGELPMQGYSSLGSMISRCAEELSVLGRIDFARAQITSDRFQRPEPRVVAHLAIARGVLGGKSTETTNRFPGEGFGPMFRNDR